ncbi:class I SAM-dependent methyltransferase [Zestomonas carbonaria]|uniref:Ubiquinone biosynthesis O-methyltransferase, mitochondrial n=1 Tax=Zestomonas carbonaria TaxID=2762745 RepID=A0A7U7ENP1_9GAMM|nr:class I SAM-dependent methyltransferase [Pseudomonas carbonaria]CAD5107405.1 Ubiquinone biosynthesis O-methyltransferase, mitochondrial [Pseudomonas carbonaria]
MPSLRKWWQMVRARSTSSNAQQQNEGATAPMIATTADCGLVDAVMGGWFRNDTGELFREFPIAPEDVVLDVGCGSGGVSMFCARRGAHVIFTDTDATKIETLQKRIVSTQARATQGIVSDSLPLPLGEGIASRVIALEVLEHVERPADILKELFRVGRPGALYFLSVPAEISEGLQRNIAPAVHFQPPNHINVFSAEEFSRLVVDSGLHIISRHSYGFFWTLWMMFYWTVKSADEESFMGATHDQLSPPFPPLLDEWASVWYKAINLPNGKFLRESLDQALPKTQIILARKPG